MQCSLQWTDAVCSGSGDDAGLTRLVSSQDEVGWSQQLSVRQQSLGTFIAKRRQRHPHHLHIHKPRRLPCVFAFDSFFNIANIKKSLI